MVILSKQQLFLPRWLSRQLLFTKINNNLIQNRMVSDYKKEFENLISTVVKEDASDLHLAEGRQPIIRSGGFLIPLTNHPILTRQDMKGILDELVDVSKKEIFLEKKEVDFAYYDANKTRFRGNAFFQLGRISIALRLVPKKIKSFEELN